MNLKVFIKRIKRGQLRTTPHHYLNERAEYLKKVEIKNQKNKFGNQMYEYDFFEKFIVNAKKYLPTSFSDYALNYEISDYQVSPKIRVLVLLDFLAVNSAKIDDSTWTSAFYTEDYKIDRMLNDYAYNYWKGTTIKYRKYVQQKFISTLVDAENDTKAMIKISEFEKLSSMLITEMLRNQNNKKADKEYYLSKWFNIVDKHNDFLINRK